MLDDKAKKFSKKSHEDFLKIYFLSKRFKGVLLFTFWKFEFCSIC